jgi:hypothetical protein
VRACELCGAAAADCFGGVSDLGHQILLAVLIYQLDLIPYLVAIRFGFLHVYESLVVLNMQVLDLDSQLTHAVQNWLIFSLELIQLLLRHFVDQSCSSHGGSLGVTHYCS